ncbi:hypothetical protein L4D13_22310 [Photobacterium profundum]|uniref:hypothetical protein n=1 Tax=Photobacterium profundum TaxID=74109 RepID=UPI003D0C7733
MSYEVLGNMVTEARNLLDSIKGGAIRVMQAQFDALLLVYKQRTNNAVTDGLAKINAVISGATALPEATFQKLIKVQGKVHGVHYLMSVSSPVYTDPSKDSYKTNQSNGILLWKIGTVHDAQPISHGLGFVGRIIGTRAGYSVEETGCEIKFIRQYDGTFKYLDDSQNSIGLKIGTFDYNGETYQTLICNYSGGGSVLLDGFAALRECAIKDANFGRYINDKDGSVFDRYAPIATVQYK